MDVQVYIHRYTEEVRGEVFRGVCVCVCVCGQLRCDVLTSA
jgi:DsbC/DsbD-like thiol-disulfide interchange protein